MKKTLVSGLIALFVVMGLLLPTTAVQAKSCNSKSQDCQLVFKIVSFLVLEEATHFATNSTGIFQAYVPEIANTFGATEIQVANALKKLGWTKSAGVGYYSWSKSGFNTDNWEQNWREVARTVCGDDPENPSGSAPAGMSNSSSVGTFAAAIVAGIVAIIAFWRRRTTT